MQEIQQLPVLPRRADDAHKGDFGLAVLVGGSRGMSGAITLAGRACLRAGAGLVRLAVPEGCMTAVAGSEPCYMTVPLGQDTPGRIAVDAWPDIQETTKTATAIGLGPGLGRSPGLDLLCCKMFMTLNQPMVIDADGLNALAGHPESITQPAGPRVLTPHPGEFARLAALVPELSGHERPHGDRERLEFAARLAIHSRSIVVLKGHRTCVTDGQSYYINTTGNPGMATGGSGDVLTGLSVGLLAQKMTPLSAAILAVHIHGLAGDLAAEQLGQESLIATDLIDHMPAAIQQYRKQLQC